MQKPKLINLHGKDIPDEIFKLIKAKKKYMEDKERNFQCGMGRATILVIKDLMNGNTK